MSDLSHEEIKNAILGTGEQLPPETSATPETADVAVPVEIPDTPYEGFETKPPTPAEHQQFDQARRAVQLSHTQTAAEQHWGRKATVITALIGTVFGGYFGARALMGGHGDEGGPSAAIRSDKTASAGANPGKNTNSSPQPEAKPAKTLADYEVSVHDYPTPADAAVQLMALESEYFSSPTPNETILSAILGTNYAPGSTQANIAASSESVRHDIQSMFHDLKVGNNKDGEYSMHFIADVDSGTETKPVSSMAYTVDGSWSQSTNFDEPPYNNPNFDFDQRYRLTVQYDSTGEWHLIDARATEDRLSTATLQ